MVKRQSDFNLSVPDRELACAPIHSDLGEAYLGAMRAGINCAVANRQVLTHLVREAFGALFPDARLDVLYDVSHNTCKVEEHPVNGQRKRLFVHRKGATRAFGPGHPDLPERFRAFGQPVLIGARWEPPRTFSSGRLKAPARVRILMPRRGTTPEPTCGRQAIPRTAGNR